jgi:hypothetical protein
MTTQLAPTRRNQELRNALRKLAPLIRYADSEPVLERAAQLTRANLSANAAIWLALVAHIRHRFTEYDVLLDDGYDRDAARYFVVEATEQVLDEWGKRIDVAAEEE